MSHYVTPFLVLNLGSEMIFVVAQRLEAQNISLERTNLVLDEIISALISKQLMTDLMKPQATYNHESVREIIEDITQSSMMRLDSVSMSKLWDLITMVFKWQITVCSEIIDVTLRHLYEIENYITNPETQLQLHKVQNLVNNFNKILSKSEKSELRSDALYWLKGCNVRVSLLMRMGLQDVAGNFVVENLNPIAEEMLKNLGENIYSVTQNGKILEKMESVHEHRKNKSQQDVNELQLFVDQILGSEHQRKLSSASSDSCGAAAGKVLQLSIDDNNAAVVAGDAKPNANFDNIDVKLQINQMMDDMSVSNENSNNNNNNNEVVCLKDDLLEMISREVNKQ